MKAYELIREAKAVDSHRVAVTFEDGRKGVFDCRPYFKMGYYKPLNNPALFKCVTVSHGWLNWPGDIDIGADDVWDEAIPAPRAARQRTTKRELARA